MCSRGWQPICVLQLDDFAALCHSLRSALYVLMHRVTRALPTDIRRWLSWNAVIVVFVQAIRTLFLPKHDLSKSSFSVLAKPQNPKPHSRTAILTTLLPSTDSLQTLSSVLLIFSSQSQSFCLSQACTHDVGCTAFLA